LTEPQTCWKLLTQFPSRLYLHPHPHIPPMASPAAIVKDKAEFYSPVVTLNKLHFW